MTVDSLLGELIRVLRSFQGYMSTGGGSGGKYVLELYLVLHRTKSGALFYLFFPLQPG